MDLGLQGKVAIVTGASKGIGKAIVETLSKEGCHVLLNYRSDDNGAKKIQEECNKNNSGKVEILKGDMGNLEFVKTILPYTISKFGKVDIVINNAGTWTKSLVKDMTLEELEMVMRVNFEGAFILSQSLVNHLIDTNRTGSILNMVSRAAINGSTRNHAHYSSSKGALVSFTKSLAREVAEYGITVNCIAPGIVNTNMMNNSIQSKEELDKHNKSIPMGRMAEPYEIADASVFLVSERAKYFTGITFDASGGILMK